MGEQAKIEVEMTAEMSKLWQSFTTIASQAAKAEGAIKGTSKAIDQAAKEQERLNRAAKAIERDMLTPQEKYNAKIKELDTLLKNAGLSQEAYRRAVVKAKSDLDQAGAAGRAAFGAKALGDLRAMATGAIGVSAAVALVTAAYRTADQARQTLADKQMSDRAAFGKLAQLAETPEQMKRLIDASDRAYGLGVGTTAGEAAKFVFDLESAGTLDQLDLFAEMESKKLVDNAGKMALSAKTLQVSMGESETGDLRGLISKSFAASKSSPGTAEEILEAASRSGVAAGEMRMSDEAVLAATAIVSQAKGNTDEAGTYLAQMMRTLQEKGGFKGKSMEDAIREVAAMEQGGTSAEQFFGADTGKKRLMQIGLTEEQAKAWFQRAGDRKEAERQGLTMEQYQTQMAATEGAAMGVSPAEFNEWFGRAQGQEAFTLLKNNMDEWLATIEEIRKSQAEDYVGTKLGLADVDPRLSAARQRAEQTAGAELAGSDVGTLRNLSEALLEQGRARIREESGAGTWRESGEMGWAKTMRFIEGDEYFLQKFRDEAQGDLRIQIDEALASRERERAAEAVPRARIAPQPGYLESEDFLEPMVPAAPLPVANPSAGWTTSFKEARGVPSGPVSSLSPGAQRQVAQLESGHATVKPVVPAPDIEMKENNRLLGEINTTLKMMGLGGSGVMTGSISPPVVEDR